MRHHIFAIVMFISALLWSSVSCAAPDQYPGDTSIYGGAVAAIQPNVLIIIDTSGSMSDSVPGSVEPYNPATVYPSLQKCDGSFCNTNDVYNAGDKSFFLSDVNDVTTSCNSVNPQALLKTTGQYSGRRLKDDGGCRTSGTRSYVLGNYVNWLNGPGKALYKQKMTIAKDVVKNIVASTSGVRFGLMRYNNNEGGQLVTATVSSKTYTAEIKNMDDIFTGTTITGTTTNRAALISAVDTLSASGYTPMGETLFEAMRYYSGGNTAFGNTAGVDASGKYTSPILAGCQQNYVIFVTDGMATMDGNAVLKTICNNGDCDADSKEPTNLLHSMDDVAKYLFDTDLSSTFDARQNVATFTIGFGDVGGDAEAVDLLTRAADSNHGHGQAYLAGDEADLANAITQIVSNIMEINTSFVAPVVPVSPENRTASASRVFIGLFKPINGAAWEGNLKKYGLDSQNYLIDKTGAFANYVDLDNNGFDDRTLVSLPLSAVNGSFILTSSSFWSSTIDAGDVTSGGAGEQLLARSTARNIYTYLGSNTILTDATNSFVTTNAGITSTLMDVADSTEKDKVINFIHGIDAYDDNSDGNTTQKREWIMGDVLHSKPMVVNYEMYLFNTANEANCAVNKTMIFAGANDGMLHAIRDCDGSEAWSYIPPELLPNLKYVHAGTHTYFVDSSAFTYTYDADRNGNIEIAEGDKVILLVGLRRGGGKNVVPANSYYYALDVSNPTTPKYLWSINNSTAAYSELAEAWSEPKIVKIKIGTTFKIAALIGAGYDNLNEDARYGATQTFPGTGAVVNADSGAGAVTSVGTSAPASPKGRGVYVIEIASLSAAGLPSFANSGAKLWEYTNATNTAMGYSVAAEIAAVDSAGRGYTDRLYTVDTDGNLWRFDIGTGNTATWSGRRVFSPNPGVSGAADKGRKSFYKPAVTLENGFDLVFYGTGDREHPLNTNVVDRIYAVKVFDTDTAVKTETNLVDVTLNLLQSSTVINTGGLTNPTVGSVEYILKQLRENDGWFIRLNESAGEKVLSSPTVFNKVLYVTTFLPTGSAVVDACQPANLGSSNTYALNYMTGEAALDYDLSNNSFSTDNKRANMGGAVLLRSDRKKGIGQGIASGVVVVISNTGKANVVVGSSGNIVLGEATKGGVVRTLFWRQK